MTSEVLDGLIPEGTADDVTLEPPMFLLAPVELEGNACIKTSDEVVDSDCLEIDTGLSIDPVI